VKLLFLAEAENELGDALAYYENLEPWAWPQTAR
jgi:hypothetical protein